MTATPRVSVIVPCHDDGPYLLEAIESLRGEPGLELVVVDDCSSDPKTISILSDLAGEVRVIRQEVNRGLAETRNKGLAETTAEYVFPLDADDLIEPGALAKMADALDREPAAVACSGDYLEVGDHSLVRSTPATLDPFRLAYRNEYPVTAMFRRSALEPVGGWTDISHVAGYEDWDLWMTLAESGHPTTRLAPGEISYRRRVRQDSMLSTSRNHHRELYRELRRRHPRIFAGVRANRRASDLPLRHKLTYPVLYGSRPRLPFERGLKSRLYRLRHGTRAG